MTAYMDRESGKSLTIRLNTPREMKVRDKNRWKTGRLKEQEEAVRRVFRASRDMKRHHEHLVHERKALSTLPSPSRGSTPEPSKRSSLITAVSISLHESLCDTHRNPPSAAKASDASTETEFDSQLNFGIQVEKRGSRPQKRAENLSFLPQNLTKTSYNVPRRLLVSAESRRESAGSLMWKKSGYERDERKEMFLSSMGWEDSASRCMPIIDFNSTFRTTVVHVEEAFSPKPWLKPAVLTSFYSGQNPRTSPRSKRYRHLSSSPKTRQKPVSVNSAESPLLPEDVYEETLPKQSFTVSKMWKYRGNVTPSLTSSIFDIRPIIAWKSRMDVLLKS